PKSHLCLADEAGGLLPDRPRVASGLLDKGLNAAASDVGRLRLGEVEDLARTYTERLHQPERALALKRAWLDDQKVHRLSPRDAEGRLALAEQYETLLGNDPSGRAAAINLLREAWKIDPGS